MPKVIVPQSLQAGDEVRVIAPSSSLATIAPAIVKIAQERLESFGLRVTFGAHVREKDMLGSSPIASRLADLHAAFADQRVKMVMCARGGFNANQLLSGIDFNLIKKNPKWLVGFSDITILLNAIYARTGLVGAHGPHFSPFGMLKGFEYSLDYFRQFFFENKAVLSIVPSKQWSDDHWFNNQAKRRFIPNDGWWCLQPGSARGTILGGNLCTFNLLQGTPYWPGLKGSILFLEDDDWSGSDGPVEFERNLTSLTQLPDFQLVRGLVIGRFQRASEMTRTKLEFIIKSNSALRGLPIAANLDFGHTTPQFFLPIGGRADLRVSAGRSQLRLSK